MFGIGFSELLLIGLALIIFIRPDDLPKVLRIAGRYYGKAKAFYNEIIQVKDRIIKEIDDAATLEESAKSAVPPPEEKPKDAPVPAPQKQEEPPSLATPPKE